MQRRQLRALDIHLDQVRPKIRQRLIQRHALNRNIARFRRPTPPARSPPRSAAFPVSPPLRFGAAKSSHPQKAAARASSPPFAQNSPGPAQTPPPPPPRSRAAPNSATYRHHTRRNPQSAAAPATAANPPENTGPRATAPATPNHHPANASAATPEKAPGSAHPKAAQTPPRSVPSAQRNPRATPAKTDCQLPGKHRVKRHQRNHRTKPQRRQSRANHPRIRIAVQHRDNHPRAPTFLRRQRRIIRQKNRHPLPRRTRRRLPIQKSRHPATVLRQHAANLPPHISRPINIKRRVLREKIPARRRIRTFLVSGEKLVDSARGQNHTSSFSPRMLIPPHHPRQQIRPSRTRQAAVARDLRARGEEIIAPTTTSRFLEGRAPARPYHVRTTNPRRRKRN